MIKTAGSRRSVSFYTLGCKVNQYETQMMKERFSEAGYEVAGEGEFADIYVINTCTVTNLSDRKSRQHIRKLKKINPQAVIAVTGCYAQMNPQAVAEIEGVCVVSGTDKKSSLVEYIEEYMERNGESRSFTESHVHSYEELGEYEGTGGIASMDSRSRAYIKVQEGCDRFCSYCIIPYARGKARSRAFDDIICEAEKLIENGCKEIVLTGINTALYGTDMPHDGKGKQDIADLLAALNDIEGDFRIRLSSLEPNVAGAEAVERIASFDKLCRHMHLSLQSGSDAVLARMNRHYSVDGYKETIRALRRIDGNYAVTTDIIVGFPGETESEFQQSLRAVREAGFARVHVFKYSRRAGTAAADMPDQVEIKVKNDRSARLIEEAERLSGEFYRKNIGTVRRVLFEKFDYEDNMAEGYTDNYIRVFCGADDPKLLLDRFAEVRLDSVYKEGMKGTIIALD